MEFWEGTELTPEELSLLLTRLTILEMGGSGKPDLHAVAELTGQDMETLERLLATIRTKKRTDEIEERLSHLEAVLRTGPRYGSLPPPPRQVQAPTFFRDTVVFLIGAGFTMVVGQWLVAGLR